MMFMHGLIRERLEECLRGAPGRKLPPELEQHLHACEECRDALNSMREHAQMLRVLASPQMVEPAPGFYARVLERIDVQQRASFWNVFLEPAFGRRVMATSLALAGLLGGYLAFTETRNPVPVANAESIMAVEEHPPNLGANVQRDRDTVLVSLATYRE
jgi:predicted anti-sigma-YlaC factor YlaD